MLLVLAGRADAQLAATVPASSGLYDRLESVSALFPTRGVFLGERALSRRELERVVIKLTATVDRAPADANAARLEWARGELGAVAAALNDDRKSHLGRRATAVGSMLVGWYASDARTERITSNGLGEIDAVTHPFAAGRNGWPSSARNVATVAPAAAVGWGDHFAVAVQPRISLIDGTSWSTDATLHRAYARGVMRNVALQVGLDERRWGQSPAGSLFISGNARPLPAVSLGTDTAFTLPWLFRLAGPVRFTALLADLGGAQDPPHAKLTGWQASIEPWSRFELGVAVLAQTGGRGAPRATLLQHLVDLVPIIDALSPQHADLQISNKLAGGNLRVRFPELSGLDIYYELQIDDFDLRRFKSSMGEDAAHLLGMRLPLLTPRGQLALRAEWQHTSLRLYEHAQFKSGVTYRDLLIGNPLGPHAVAGQLSAEWRPSPLRSFSVTVAEERRDPSQYVTAVSGTRERGFRFVPVSNDPDYYRRRVTASFERSLSLGTLAVGTGYNRAWRTNGAGRDEWLGQITYSSLHLPTF